MTTLPHSPLTLAELNARWREARDEIAYRVMSAFRMDGGLDDADTAGIARLTARYDGYLAAALARCEDGAA